MSLKGSKIYEWETEEFGFSLPLSSPLQKNYTHKWFNSFMHTFLVPQIGELCSNAKVSFKI